MITIKDFLIEVLQECLTYQKRFQAEVERLEDEGYTITTGGPEDYRIWRTNEVLFSMPGGQLDDAVYEAVAKFGIKPYHLDYVLADDPSIELPLPVPGLPARLVSEMQCAVWNLTEEDDIATLAEYIDWPVEKVKTALSSPALRSPAEAPEAAGT